MKFTFKLEKVLDLRKRKEQERERELANLKELLMRAEAFLEELKKEAVKISGKMSALQGESKERLDIKELLRYYDYLEGLRKNISLQITQIKKLITDIEKKREELIQASKERKIIEKLKDNQYKKFKKTLDAWEQKFLDEVGTAHYNQKRRLWKQ